MERLTQFFSNLTVETLNEQNAINFGFVDAENIIMVNGYGMSPDLLRALQKYMDPIDVALNNAWLVPSEDRDEEEMNEILDVLIKPESEGMYHLGILMAYVESYSLFDTSFKFLCLMAKRMAQNNNSIIVDLIVYECESMLKEQKSRWALNFFSHLIDEIGINEPGFFVPDGNGLKPCYKGDKYLWKMSFWLLQCDLVMLDKTHYVLPDIINGNLDDFEALRCQMKESDFNVIEIKMKATHVSDFIKG